MSTRGGARAGSVAMEVDEASDGPGTASGSNTTPPVQESSRSARQQPGVSGRQS